MTTTPDPRDEQTRTPSEPPTTPASPGPDPDDLDEPHGTDRPAHRAEGTPPAEAPASPGPNPDDINR